jgi:outer membrane protein insertion porin family
LILSKIRYYFLLFSVLLLLQGCTGVRYLKENERLLYNQTIKGQPKDISKSTLKDLYVQKENQKAVGGLSLTPRWIHYSSKKNFDSKKYEKKIAKIEKKYNKKIAKAKSDNKVNNLLFTKQSKIDKMNDRIQNGTLFMQWIDPITVYDSTATNLTVAKFSDYLFSNGYFNNSVGSCELVHKNKRSRDKERITDKVRIEYSIKAGKPYRIDTVFYRVTDSAIYNLLLDNRAQSFLIKGQRYQQDNFSKERERIDLLLKDNGYYDFSRQYVEFETDTAYRPNRRIGIQVIINDPAKRGYHKKFLLDEVNFTTDAGLAPPSATLSRTKRVSRNVNYLYFERNYSLKVLGQRVFVAPGEHYSRKATFDTQRQLANLNNFRFVNINYDTADGKFIANIFTSSLDRYQWSNEVGMSITQGTPGPFYNLNFLKRNIFKGSENFEMNGRIGYEGVFAATGTNESVYRSIEGGVNAAISFPQFLLPLKDEKRYALGRVNPRTRVQMGYTYTNRPEYIRKATSANLTYSWDNQRIRRYDFTVVNLSVIRSETDPEYQQFLDEQFVEYGNPLIYSFNPSFVSSMIFAMTWNFNNYGSPGTTSAFFRWAVESGGTLQNLVDISAKGLQKFKYIRVNADFRRVKVLDKTTMLAYRFNAGAAYAYSDTTGALPYEKYFFAGGSNSIRAWRPRRLGQGSFKPDVSEDIAQDGYFNYQFEKPGDILLEGSVELRKKIFGFIEGAVFIDAGNVWTFKPLEDNNENRGNSEFKLNQFYREIGVGTGFGLRFNFSFLILRFDVGIKAYDPARDEGEKFVLHKLRFFRPYTSHNEPVIYNIGIGYSF